MNFDEKNTKKIVTGGWVSPPHELFGGKNFITQETYNQVAESGMDFLFTQYENPKTYGDKYIIKALEFAQNAGVGLFIGDYRVGYNQEETKQLIEKYTKYSSFTGFNLFDEPGIAKFDELENIRQNIKKIDENVICFVNLLPMYAYSTILKGTYKLGDTQMASEQEYQEYIAEYEKRCGSDLISYDFYPLRFEYGVFDENYFKQMYYIYSCAKRLDLPFWTFIQVTSWNPEIRVVSNEEIAWQVHTSIASGAAGIMYFTYWLPVASEVEFYKGAIIESNGEKGNSFETIKGLNNFIHKIGQELRNAEHKGLVCSSSFCKYIPDGYKTTMPKGVSVDNLEDLLIGVFYDGQDVILYLVNVSFEEQKSFNVALDEEACITLDTITTTTTERVKSLNIVLEKGEGVKLLINKLLV